MKENIKKKKNHHRLHDIIAKQCTCLIFTYCDTCIISIGYTEYHLKIEFEKKY